MLQIQVPERSAPRQAVQRQRRHIRPVDSLRPCVQHIHQRYHGLGFASVELEPPPTNGSFLSGLLCLRFQERVDRRGSWEPHVRGWQPPVGWVRRRHHRSSSSQAPLSPKPATAAGQEGQEGREARGSLSLGQQRLQLWSGNRRQVIVGAQRPVVFKPCLEQRLHASQRRRLLA